MQVRLGEITNITTGKLDSNASVDGGQFPFFTCSPETLAINDYAFECEAVLLAGNNAKGMFPVKHYEGKFNAYQRTYVITPKDRNKLDSKYLYYQLSQLTQLLQVFSVGTATKFLTLKILRPLPILLPPLPEQRAIAHILGTLDDKIELNRRMNKTLEAIARAIFKSWFVDFDPVRAKAEGRDAGLPNLIADLFPERFVDSEVGEIPEGWSAGSFGDVIIRRREKIGDKEAIVLSAIAKGELVKSDDHFIKRVYSRDISKYLSVHKWDIAYNPSRINIGSVGMLKESIIGAVSPAYIVVQSTKPFQWFMEFSLRRSYTTEWINILASGSVRQSLSFDDFASIPCIIPPERIIQVFNDQWLHIKNAIDIRINEISTLAEIRDALRPKLISGEFRIPESEQITVGSAS